MPQTIDFCKRVDIKTGLWYDCGCGKRVPVREGRPWTIGRFNDHLKHDAKHRDWIRRTTEMKQLELKKKSDGQELTTTEKSTLLQLMKVQTPMSTFFQPLPKPDGKGSIPSTKETVPKVNADTVDLTAGGSPSRKLATCEGILPDYCKKGIYEYLRVYALYSTVHELASYVIRYMVMRRHSFAQLFSKGCTRGRGVMRNTRKGTIFSCPECDRLRYVFYFV